jgi:hypothetical protein
MIRKELINDDLKIIGGGGGCGDDGDGITIHETSIS